MDYGAKRIHLQRTSLRPLWAQLQHQTDGPQDLTGASWDIYVSVWREYLLNAVRTCVTFAAAVSWWQHRVCVREREKYPGHIVN